MTGDAALGRRLVAASDAQGRRLQRRLHDGAQQRLVQTVITLKLARAALGEQDGPAVTLVDEALTHAQRGLAELRAVVHAIMPSALGREGLRAGVDSLAAELGVAVDIDIAVPRLDDRSLETTAYLVVAEALAGAVTRVRVRARVADGVLEVEVRGGDGGRHLLAGPGLAALRDRLTANGGRLAVDGTVVRAWLPVA
ncbi:sensor histidine kinase [Conexibacter woesei]|uniref:sensor histidine kinase n=1 Tax=Conexibacter woesei TaxID=191495 RepID=UPI00041A850C|nr:histidine kinase [Conexibacter woesei]